MSLSEASLSRRLRTPFRYCASVGSANDIARDWLLEGAPAGAAVIADEQTHGRGRRGRIWHTPPGSALAMSVVLHPHQDFVSRAVQLGALAVCDLAAGLGCRDIGIKLPNDALIQGKKVGGVLPEAVWDGARLRGVALGIGVNVRVDLAAAELGDTAINLEAAAGRRLCRADLVAELLRHLMGWYRRIETDEMAAAWKVRVAAHGGEDK